MCNPIVGDDGFAQRIEELTGLVLAIDDGELFAAAPAQPEARARHEVGLTLVSLLRRQMEELRDACRAKSDEASEVFLVPTEGVAENRRPAPVGPAFGPMRRSA